MTLSGGTGEDNGAWKAYIAQDYEHRYHSGLFESKGAAKEFLRKSAKDTVDNLTAISPLNNVLAAEISGPRGATQLVVLRGEKIHHQRELHE